MNTEPREPSRLPIRGTIATVGTVGALALLLSFRGGPLAPGDPVIAAVEPEPEVADELIPDAITETSSAEAAAGSVTIAGEFVATRWGDVQVEVTLDGADVTEVVALVLPADDHHSADISDYVEPILREEAITYDSADVSVISGATYTCEAYAESLQSALDQAGMVGAPATVMQPEPEVAAAKPVDVVADAAEAGDVMSATGEAISIRWGEVQVAVTVQGDDIIAVETLAIPMDDRKSERINAQAEPALREEAIASDSADVSVVSGATYTSKAYAASLQSALDQLNA